MTHSRPSLDEKIALLRRPETYPDPTTRVEVIETHMSWVFLTEGRVYKLKKPIRFKLLNLSTLEDRRRNCHAEVRLNRRLAPDVYLGVVPVGVDENGCLGLGGRTVDVADWLVKMQRLPARRMLENVIESGDVPRDGVRRLGEVLAGFYRRARPVEIEAAEYRGRFVADVHETVRELEELSSIPNERIEGVSTALLGYLDRRSEVLDRRVQERRIVEGHGDLRPEHVCLLPTPVVIDCVEFSRELRTLDPIDELSFLAIECFRLRGPAVAFIEATLLETYARGTDDEPPRELVGFYKAFRAFFRAQVAIWHLRDDDVDVPAKWNDKAEGYVALAEQLVSESPELSGA